MLKCQVEYYVDKSFVLSLLTISVKVYFVFVIFSINYVKGNYTILTEILIIARICV